MTVQDVTPESSTAPIYLDPTPLVPSDVPNLDALVAEQASARAAAVTKLVALGLTEEEALALVGG
jgi:hypothetical protein